MPTLNKPKKKPREHHKSINNQMAFDEVYNTTKWRKLRQSKFEANPICEICQRNNKVSPTTEIHHIITVIEDPTKAFLWSNLIALCTECHHNIHKNKHKINQRK